MTEAAKEEAPGWRLQRAQRNRRGSFAPLQLAALGVGERDWMADEASRDDAPTGPSGSSCGRGDPRLDGVHIDGQLTVPASLRLWESLAGRASRL